MRCSLSGICSMSSLMPLSPGPICIHWQIRVPEPSGCRVNRQCAAGSAGSPTAQPKTRSGSNSQIVDTVSQVPRASW